MGWNGGTEAHEWNGCVPTDRLPKRIFKCVLATTLTGMFSFLFQLQYYNDPVGGSELTFDWWHVVIITLLPNIRRMALCYSY